MKPCVIASREISPTPAIVATRLRLRTGGQTLKPKELETKWIRWWAVAVAVVVVVVVVSQPAGHGWPAILAGLPAGAKFLASCQKNFLQFRIDGVLFFDPSGSNFWQAARNLPEIEKSMKPLFFQWFLKLF